MRKKLLRATLILILFTLIYNSGVAQCVAPTAYTLGGGGSYCSGGSGVTITLSNSQTGISYQLKLGSTSVGSAQTGTSGTSLSWNSITGAGTYTVVATDLTTSCTKTMNGSAVVTVLALPTNYTVAGTASICAGAATTVTLSGSQTGINYQLTLNGASTGSLIVGTGAALSWPGQTIAGQYQVTATNATAGCIRTMSTSLTLTVKPLPQIFNVTGGGTYCPGATGVTVNLSGSVSGTTYQLKNGTTNVGTAKSGTGAALSWTNITSTGTLTIVATLTACTQLMSGSVNISVLAAPSAFNLSSPTSGGFCSGGAGATINLSGSETNATYQLKRASTLVGSAVPGTGNILTWTNLTTAGTYTVVATSTATSCTTTMTGSVAITSEAIPTAYTVGGGGAYCTGANSVSVTLSNSQTNDLYQLKLNGVALGSPLTGTTGSALTWPGLTQLGTYTVDALTPKASCTRTMTGSAIITQATMPSIFTVSGGGSFCSGSTGPTITLSSSQTGVNYQLQVGSTNVGSVQVGTGSSLTWQNNTTDGTYTVVATSVSQGCTQGMSGSALVTVNALPTVFDVTGGQGKPINLSGSSIGVNYQLSNNGSNAGPPIQGTGYGLAWTNYTPAEAYSVIATNATTNCAATMNGSVIGLSTKDLIDLDSLQVVFIPEAVKVSRLGKINGSALETNFGLSTLNNGDINNVFPGPPCLIGNYYVGFQLYYDLSDKSTEKEWGTQLSVSLLHGTSQLWSAPLTVNSKNQTFVATNFYSLPISCDGTYSFKIDKKLLIGQVPQSSISLKILLYKDGHDSFDISSALNLNCSYNGEVTTLSWTYAGKGADEYDLEWVSIADHEGFVSGDPFSFKEPVRVTTPTLSYAHQVFYQTGRIWYRARAVSYPPQYPDHRIIGNWFYSNCSPLVIANPESQKNWQVQTVFAEEGKNKKVVQYFDGTLRSRQSQTNLSSENVTLAAETLYDFEGRKSLEVLAAPEASFTSSLKFKPGINTFAPTDQLVLANTSGTREKFHYDNYTAENSTLATANGAGRYYSDQNIAPTVHSVLIPNGEGFVYSQTEYLNDGTGRVKRQSGVGKEFKIDGSHNTKYFYGGVAPAEVIRLFGTNVGNATHYKKNLVVDANGQVSVSYHDQADKVIATALAGEKPTNLLVLPSYTALNGSAVEVDISSLNQRTQDVSVTNHKILNVAPNTLYTFKYNVTASNPSFDANVCPDCKLDLTITITDPLGNLLNLSTAAGNQSADPYQYQLKGISGLSCTPQNSTVQIDLVLSDVGDYTITKTLQGGKLDYDELKTLISARADVQSKIQQIRDSYVPDASQCDVCATSDCADTDGIVQDAMKKIASLDCENIKNRIIATLIANHSNDPNYYPTDTEIKADADYCRYELCVLDQAGDVFEKQLSLAPNWTKAVEKGYNNAVDQDPFFNDKGLSGYGYKNKMVDRLNSIVIGDLNANLKTARPIQQVVDPFNPLYYIDAQGNATNSASIGYHILYYELMRQNPPDLSTQLDNQRWSLYRWLYQEAKRKTKLINIPAYSIDCPKAKEELERTDKLPTTEDGANNWTDVPPGVKTVSDEQIEMTYAMLIQSCDPTTARISISSTDETTIKDNLGTYFDSNPDNFYKLILKKDLDPATATNPVAYNSLMAIKNILATYGGCESVVANTAVDDPLVCKTTKTIIAPASGGPNLVVNPGVNPTPDCTPYITNNGCYNGWSAQSGAPQVIEPGVIRIWGQRRNIASTAVGGSVSLPDGLVPGKKYRFSVTYRADTQNDNVYCQFFNNDGYKRASGPTYKYGESVTPFTEACSTNEPITNPSIDYCTMPLGALHPTAVLVNGMSSDRVWMKQNAPQGNWTTDEVIFTATERSTNFVFTTIPVDCSLGDTINKNLTTWGNNGSFETGNVESIPQMFFGTNTLGNVIDYPYGPPGVGGSKSLSINNTSGPQAKGGMLLKFNAISDSHSPSTFFVTAWVKTQQGSSISRNPNALLYITTQHPDWEILDQNRVPFCNTEGNPGLWKKLRLTIARKPGVGIVPLPDFFSISTTMTDSEAIIGAGSLLVDQIEIYGTNSDQNYTINRSITQTIDIKNVIIQEYYEPTRTFCIEYQTPDVRDYIAEYKTACMAHEVEAKGLLAQMAVDNYLEEEITNITNTAQCLDGASESFKYTYTPKEYHYTLYYYDQAGNLVQTVPPEGVNPLTAAQLNSFATTPVDPAHRLVTRYQYNSLNQLIYQTTPDAGQSQFWYNNKGQLRLSQNAQQNVENHYSYTKYDVQGRISEVGEMTASDPIANLIAQVDDADFPKSQDLGGTYLLTDITRTHYDFANTIPQWTNLVNVTVKGNSLTNTGGTNWQDHAFTVNSIPANQDGYIEFRVGTATSDFAFGLSSTDQGTINTINYGLRLQAGLVYVLENSNPTTAFTAYAPNDLLRIERLGGTIYYKKNGITFLTSDIASTSALFGDVNMNTVGSVINDIAMGILPSSNSYASGNQSAFIQQNLRNRVSWVEVIDKPSAIAQLSSAEGLGARTYYSYDIHGNVKTLQQQLPGLPNKRTDYVYDLVSGKVNFVMYQFGEKDQLVHQYQYDADNRITEVKTSSDRFIWDTDAEYQYYLHGPLARTMLGQYKVQGLDYYYTLQGWLKGVNSPTGTTAQANDPGGDGYGTSLIPKDVMAFNLGYYPGDYQPILSSSNSALIENTSPQLWTGTDGNPLNLFNGNISWMATDLPAIPSAKANRSAGVQAMQYNYDQLNRIIRSRSLAYNGSIVARSTSPAAYDEDYSYDANGNLLTLLRNNELGAVKDNFNYQYYTGTNRLLGVKPVTEDVVYASAVTSNLKIYRNITVQGNAYIPDGADVMLRATENIFVHPQFNKAGGNSFRASIVNEGPYLYDAIGNLIADEEEGTEISWTPYGKVRQVKAKGDSVITTYRYDASGNRIEKRVRQIVDKLEDVSQAPLPSDQDMLIPTTGPANYVPVRNVTLTQETINGVSYTKANLYAVESTPGLWLNGEIPVVAGERYTYRVRGYRTTSCKAFLYIFGTKGATSVDVLWYTNLLPLGAANEGWTEGTFTVPAGVTSIRPGVLWDAYNQFVGETMYIREFSITKLKKLPVVPASYNSGGDVELLGETINAVNYVRAYLKVASNTPGLFFSDPISVKPGTQYTYRVLGYTATSGPAFLYVQGIGYSDLVWNTVQLPASAASENWVEATFTVPATVTSIKVGVLWRLPAVGETMYIQEASLTETITPDLVTHYVRDASGNVMGIYQNALLTEQPLYGSSRLGEYRGGRKEGQQRLGFKTYELSNHLGNVLAVITDHINMTAADGVYATVLSSTDYYPFGLEMKGRTYSSDKYRYGFNGKEKDNTFASASNYDYGFRIYSPSIARFLSVDPLKKDYPWYTPYQFAGNTPIESIDLDGLEEVSNKVISNVRFIELKNVTFKMVIRQANESLTTAMSRSIDPKTDNYSVNTQMGEIDKNANPQPKYTDADSPQPNFIAQGYSINGGKIVSGRSAEKTWYLSISKNYEVTAGMGDPANNSDFAIGGATPIYLNGLKYGTTNIWKSDTPKGIDQISKGSVPIEDQVWLVQKSNGVYSAQNSEFKGKTVLAFNSSNKHWMVASQENELLGGLTLDAIRDKLISEGYNLILGFDGSNSAALLKNGSQLTVPADYKNFTMPTGVTLVVPKPAPTTSKKIKPK